MSDKKELYSSFHTLKNSHLQWKKKSGIEKRCQLIKAFALSLGKKKKELARVLAEETGKPITQACGEISACQERLTYFLEECPKILEILTPSYHHKNEEMEEVCTYEPLGVIACISAWNYPYFVGLNVLIPALLMGNCVLYKPSEYALDTGLALTELLYEAGIPREVFQCVVGDATTGRTLLELPFDGVWFTGSYSTGRSIAQTLAPKMTKVNLELGGKDGAYVCEDAHLEKSVSSLVSGAFYNSGQSCCGIERIYVHQEVYPSFVHLFCEEVDRFQVGDPLDEKTDLGPLTRKEQLNVLQKHVEDALSKGAVCLRGGHRMDREGFFFSPTVLTEVTSEMLVMREESFGPLIGIEKVEGDEEGLRKMSDTHYGLTGAIFSQDKERAHRLLSQLNVGTAYWNCCDRVSPFLPWSGRNYSGIGVTLSHEGIRSFLQPKAWHLTSCL